SLLAAVEGKFKAPLGSEKTFPKTNTYQLALQGAPYKTVDVTTTVYFAAGTAPVVGKARVLAALQGFFAITTKDPQGQDIPNPSTNFGFYFKDANGLPSNQIVWSDLFDLVRNAPGIRKVDPGLLLNGLRDDVSIGLSEFPRLGKVLIVNGETGATL